MTLVATILLFAALSPAEMIERLKAPPITKVEGLVQVYANCPAEMRREYQMPVADFVADVCRSLYLSRSVRPRRFAEPGVVVYLGDVTTNDNTVVALARKRTGGELFTRIYLRAPAFADVGKFRLEAAKAFFRAVEGRELDDAEATRELRKANPRLKIDDEYAELAKWRRGEGTEDDEHYLKLARSVLAPGTARSEDVLHFASRLYLYPAYFDSPFCGKYPSCDFREAIKLAKDDIYIRFAAYFKSTELPVWGGGHGEKMNAAVSAYVDFLMALAKYELSEGELTRLLDDADAKLAAVNESGCDFL